MDKKELLSKPIKERREILQKQAKEFVAVFPHAYEPCPLCGEPSTDGNPHKECADYEAMMADIGK